MIVVVEEGAVIDDGREVDRKRSQVVPFAVFDQRVEEQRELPDIALAGNEVAAPPEVPLCEPSAQQLRALG